MKTPIQLLIDIIEMDSANNVIIDQKTMHKMLKNSLPLERQAIEMAVNYQKLNFTGNATFKKNGAQYFQDVYGEQLKQQELPF